MGIMNKKGNVDNFYVLIVFFGFAVFLLVGLKIWGEITSTEMQEDVFNKTSQGITAMENGDNFFNNLDNLGTLIYIGLHIGVLITGFLLRSHPVVFIAMILLIAILVIVASPLSDAYEDIKLDFPSESVDLPKVNLIMANLALFETIWAFLTAVVMFGLAKYEGNI